LAVQPLPDILSPSFFTPVDAHTPDAGVADTGLLRIRAEMNAAFASMSDAIWIADAGGRTVRFNGAFLKAHRFTDEHSGCQRLDDCRALFLLRHPDGGAVDFSEWPGARALRGEFASSQVFEIQRRDTSEAWMMSYSYAPILSDIDGHLCGAVVTGRDVTEHFRLRRDLEASRTRLRRLLAVQHRAAEKERRRIAQDLHDDLQQHLAAIRIELAMALNGWTIAPAHLAASARRAHEMTGEALEAVRRIVQDLRPRILDGQGLAAALRGLLAGFGERTGIDCHFFDESETVVDDGEAERENADAGPDGALAEDLATSLYRVAQESLTNIHRHANAGTVEMRFGREGTGQVRLTIRDDGVGLSAQDLSRNHSLGILGMQERLAAHGGRLDVRGAPNGGTIVEAIAPPAPPQAEAEAAEREREREREIDGGIWWQNNGPGSGRSSMGGTPSQEVPPDGLLYQRSG
jgi:signal transduction histidine kinase